MFMLTYEQTMELLEKSKQGDEQAKTILLTENENLIRSVLRRFRGRGESYEDLYQIACVGFMKAIANFDPSFGVRFSTYLVPMLAGEIKRFMRDDGIIKVSRVIKAQRLAVNKFIEKYKDEHDGEEPTVEEVAAALAIDKTDVVLALDSAKMPLSLYEKLDDDEGAPELIDKIAAEPEQEEKMLNKIMLRSVINELDLRSRKIILLRYFRDKTQAETAKELGVSQVQVSRLESKILNIIKEKIAN